MIKKLTSLAIAAGLMLSLSLGATAQDMHDRGADDMHGMRSMHGIPRGGDGPVFRGRPELRVTSALVHAGDGPGHFSIAHALIKMVGRDAASGELHKLTRQYGEEAVASWVQVSDFSVDEAGELAAAQGIRMPRPEPLSGKGLARRLVSLGLSPDGTFYEGTLLDRLVSHKIHDATMDAIDAKYGTRADGEYHRISNQAMYDLAQALGDTDVKLAPFH